MLLRHVGTRCTYGWSVLLSGLLGIGATNCFLKRPVQVTVAGMKGVDFSHGFFDALLLLDLASHRQVKDQVSGKMWG